MNDYERVVIQSKKRQEMIFIGLICVASVLYFVTSLI